MNQNINQSNQQPDIKSLVASFSEAVDKPKVKPITPAIQLLIESMPSIQTAIKNGWSYRAIAKWFTEKGMKVDERTVATFCAEKLGIRRTKRRTKVTKNKINIKV